MNKEYYQNEFNYKSKIISTLKLIMLELSRMNNELFERKEVESNYVNFSEEGKFQGFSSEPLGVWYFKMNKNRDVIIKEVITCYDLNLKELEPILLKHLQGQNMVLPEDIELRLTY